jgi:hypothetical protein
LKLHDFRKEENMKMRDELSWLPAWLICMSSFPSFNPPVFFLWVHSLPNLMAQHFSLFKPAILKSLFLWRRNEGKTTWFTRAMLHK